MAPAMIPKTPDRSKVVFHAIRRLLVSRVLTELKAVDLPDDITRHSPEGSTKDQTTVKGKSGHSDGGVSPPLVTNSRHDDRDGLEPCDASAKF
jgi:hypothetical protein